MRIDRIASGCGMIVTYIRANIILLFKYNRKTLSKTKWFLGGKHGEFTAIGWRWVVDDYHACRRMKVNRQIPWPVSPRISIVNPNNISFHLDDLNNFQGFGNYYQALGRITIGRGTYIAPNVGIITSNHMIHDLDKHEQPKPVCLGKRCWIGMNSVILPGVQLGDNTIVGAGSVVTKSFPSGNVVIAGTPARVIRQL